MRLPSEPSLILARSCSPFCQTARAGGKPKTGWALLLDDLVVSKQQKRGAECAAEGTRGALRPSVGAFGRALNIMINNEKNYNSGRGTGFATHSAVFAGFDGAEPCPAPLPKALEAFDLTTLAGSGRVSSDAVESGALA